jgi:carboxylesterase type B
MLKLLGIGASHAAELPYVFGTLPDKVFTVHSYRANEFLFAVSELDHDAAFQSLLNLAIMFV